MASSWSELPLDIFGSILQLLPFIDHVRLSCVCTAWRSAARSNKFRPVPQLPWLMDPSSIYANSSPSLEQQTLRPPTTVDFLSLSENRVYSIPDPDPSLQTRVIIGSSMGWLITADERSELHLSNPFTGSQISLPSFLTLPHIEAFDKWGVRHYLVGKQTPLAFTADDLRHYLYVKAIVASSSHSSDDYTVVLIYNPHERLAFAKPGDGSWTILQEPCHGFRDVIHHEGKFYTLDRHGNVEAWDFTGPLPKSTFRTPKFEGDVYRDVRYLVGSSSGDLLQVHRSGCLFDSFDSDLHESIKFKVFKMDPNENGWVRVKGLGNEALFLGCSHSTSLSNMPRLRGNTIYFTGNRYQINDAFVLDLEDKFASCIAGIFNMEDSGVERCFGCHISSKSSLPIWITPSTF